MASLENEMRAVPADHFFFFRFGRCRTRLGPYNCVSSEKQHKKQSQALHWRQLFYAHLNARGTLPGRKKCSKELRFQNTGLTLHAGAPVPARSQSVSAVGGKYLGVTFLSSAQAA